MKLKVKTPFNWAHHGVRVESFAVGQIIDTEDPDLIEVSQREGWTTKPRANGKEGDTTDAPAPPPADAPPPGAPD